MGGGVKIHVSKQKKSKKKSKPTDKQENRFSPSVKRYTIAVDSSMQRRTPGKGEVGGSNIPIGSEKKTDYHYYYFCLLVGFQ